MKGLALAVILAALVVAAPAQSLRSQVEAMDKAVHKCMMAKDAEGFKRLMKGGVTSDFTYVESGHKMNFDQMVQGMAMGLGQMKKMVKADSQIVTLMRHGNTAIITTKHYMEGTVAMGSPKPHKMSFKGMSTDSYVKEDGKWKLSKMTWGKQTMLVDGKPINARRSEAAIAQ